MINQSVFNFDPKSYSVVAQWGEKFEKQFTLAQVKNLPECMIQRQSFKIPEFIRNFVLIFFI